MMVCPGRPLCPVLNERSSCAMEQDVRPRSKVSCARYAAQPSVLIASDAHHLPYVSLAPRTGGAGMQNAQSEFLARCRRCGQPVREDHSHVMIVPVGRGRMFFHAGCWRIKAVRDPVDERPEAEREASSA